MEAGFDTVSTTFGTSSSLSSLETLVSGTVLWVTWVTKGKAIYQMCNSRKSKLVGAVGSRWCHVFLCSWKRQLRILCVKVISGGPQLPWCPLPVCSQKRSWVISACAQKDFPSPSPTQQQGKHGVRCKLHTDGESLHFVWCAFAKLCITVIQPGPRSWNGAGIPGPSAPGLEMMVDGHETKLHWLIDWLTD